MKWEYITKHHSVNLNELGGDGWELCAVERTYWYVLKRPMECKNCQFYKSEIVYTRDGHFLSKKCSEGEYPMQWDGCRKFKSKSNDDV